MDDYGLFGMDALSRKQQYEEAVRWRNWRIVVYLCGALVSIGFWSFVAVEVMRLWK
jgi:hypothetical protein